MYCRERVNLLQSEAGRRERKISGEFIEQGKENKKEMEEGSFILEL